MPTQLIIMDLGRIHNYDFASGRIHQCNGNFGIGPKTPKCEGLIQEPNSPLAEFTCVLPIIVLSEFRSHAKEQDD